MPATAENKKNKKNRAKAMSILGGVGSGGGSVPSW